MLDSNRDTAVEICLQKVTRLVLKLLLLLAFTFSQREEFAPRQE